MLGFLGGDYSFFAHATDTRPTRDSCQGAENLPRRPSGAAENGDSGASEVRSRGGPGAGRARGRTEELGGGPRNSGEDRGTRGRIEELSPPPEPGEVLGAATRAVSGQLDIVKS